MIISEKLEWDQLTPLFWSEIASSYMVSNIFDRHKDITAAFLSKYLELKPEKISEAKLEVVREKNYPGKGHIDVFVSAADDFCVIIEVKVHDFASARTGQLERYIETAIDNRPVDSFKDAYLVYLTQFNLQNFQPANNHETPRSIAEFAAIRERFAKDVKKMVHINWAEFHAFISEHFDKLTMEEKLILSLQRQWTEGKDKADRERFRNKKGERALSYYLEDINPSLLKNLAIGTQRGDRFLIPLRGSSEEDRTRVLDTLKTIFKSRSINKVKLPKKEYAVKAADEFMAKLINGKVNLDLFPFYKDLFGLANTIRYLQLDGTGKDGFSINAKIHRIAKVSLCTILTSKHEIEIRLKR